ncbi:M23 family metallopeptidase [Halorussus caseinilyticus]|uniref:Peptidoglycan DD-metalloendopeptidase family protein n=1 Tax=Halorussus caseinilyticus TaxID=3034025 RepID=A0ABD5WRH8_9EURY|nr:M23 family metallopeptidase [Halorussus sp. DT72]
MVNDETSRRSFLKASGAAVAGTAALTGTAAAAKDYEYLTPVFTTSDLNVREDATTSAGIVATAAKRTGGRVFQGPESSDGYNWWKVQFSGDGDNGSVTGWVAEDWLSSANFACPMTGTVTSTYWDTRDGGTRYHRAVDFADGGGTPIHAAAGGTAEQRYDDGGYGNWLIIYHGNGWKTGYGHLQSFNVADGATVSRGDVVAYEGDTGAGTGPHLDFQVWDPDWNKRRSYYDKYDEAVQGTGVPRVFF